MTAGKLAAREWFAARCIFPAPHGWYATILLATDKQAPGLEIDESRDTRFRLEIHSEEWAFLFTHAGNASWIRVTDVPFVHGRDDFQLLALAPALKDIGALLRRLEHEHALSFRRDLCFVDTNLPDAEPSIRQWVESL